MAQPKLIVFDLDYTLWPFFVDTHVDPPFQKEKGGDICDRNGERVECYKDVPDVLLRLHEEGYKLGLASRTSSIPEAKDLVKLFDWDKYFQHDFREIYPGSKTTHFQKFALTSGLPFKEMLFFDDEPRNIRDVGQLGVTCILADNGVTTELLQHGLQLFARNHKAGMESSQNR